MYNLKKKLIISVFSSHLTIIYSIYVPSGNLWMSTWNTHKYIKTNLDTLEGNEVWPIPKVRLWTNNLEEAAATAFTDIW